LLHEREAALRERETLMTEAQTSLDRLIAVEVQSKLAEKQQVTDYHTVIALSTFAVH